MASTISPGIEGETALIRTDREGLLSPADNLMFLAKETPESHIHFDGHNSLEDGSADWISRE